MTPEDLKLQVFCDTHDLENLIKEPTCFKGKNPSCIDLILTNQKQLFMKSRTFITGISDFHALTTSIMKLTYTKGNPKIKFYRDYKNFDNDLFKVDLENSLRNLTDLTYTSFEKVFLRTLDCHAPIKKKILRANENSFMSKALRKAIMMRSRMKNLYLKNKTDLNWSNYKTQRNFCTNLLRKTKKEYFSKLDIIKISDSKKFWKTIKPFFSDKGLNCNKMMLSENDQIISDETTIADTMSKYFVNITNKLKLKQSETEINELSLSEILDKYKDHQSIVKIRSPMNGEKNSHSNLSRPKKY